MPSVLLINAFRDHKRYIPSHLIKFVAHTPTNIGQYRLLPLDLAYIAGVLKNKFEVAIFDAHTAGVQAERIDFRNSDCVVVNTAPFSHWRCCQTFIGHSLDVIKAAKSAGSKVIVYGPHATMHPELFADADCVIRGEPEPLIEQALRSNEKILGPVGIESLPLPDFGAFDFSLYESKLSTQIFENNDFGKIGVIAHSRGCPFKCGFCFRALAPHKVGFHPLEHVEAMLKMLIEKHGCSCLFWEDLTFSINKPRTLQLCALIKKYKVPYIIQTRADCIDKEIAQALSDSGCYKVEIGGESGTDSILKSLNKQVDWNTISSAIQLCRVAGIPRTVAFAGLFAPGETIDTIRETRRKFKEAGLRFYFNIWFPYPSTAIHTFGIQSCSISADCTDWNQLLPLAGTIGTGMSTNKVRNICKVIENQERLDEFFRKLRVKNIFFLLSSKLYYFIKRFLRGDSPSSNLQTTSRQD